ncbi:MAG: beta-propeller domain-containing protein [Myxococcales bacterium]|nr:beta-propeller domain-containing protein [Myxococcales bacterium]
MRGLRQLVCWGMIAAAAGCSSGRPPEPDPDRLPDNPVEIGQEEFITLERDYSGDRSYASDSSEGAAGSANGSAAPNEKAPGGREGTVEEADIYRVDNNRLFYLNTYRGFIIYDLNDPRSPKRVARLPVHGYPVEMFVTPTTVYALLRDALYLTQDKNGLVFKRHNVSQLVAIDITDLSNPKVLKTIDIVGELREGVSRKIDDTIYVVSHIPQSYYWRGYPYGDQRTEQAWVYSFNVKTPSDPVLVQKLKVFEGGGYSSWGTSGGSSRWFSGVAISATSNTLHVVENWYTYGYVSGSKYNCGSYRSMQQAVVSIIDISDPSGNIRLHSRFETYGALTDQFKQTYVYDPATGKGHYFGIFARQEWGTANCQGSMFVQNALEAWDVTDGANPVRVGSLAFGKPNETVRGTAFDTDRKVAYAITAQRIDPLYALSIADPTNLKVLSAIDGLSGDMNVFRLIGGGQFLMGIGRDNSETCTGYGNPTVGWATNVAVSVIDVRNLAGIRLVQRKCVTVNNAQWVWSEINWNLDQAHKMIGMHSDARASVISVPVSYYAKSSTTDRWWWYRPESAVGLMSYDLAAYDPSKDHLNQKVLLNHGTVVHPHGHVRRSVVFTHQGATARRMMVNLSDTHVSVVDVDNLDTPVDQSLIEVAPQHKRLYRFGDYLVDEVRIGGEYDWQPGTSEFRVKRALPGADEAQAVASFSVARVAQVVQVKDLLVLFRSVDSSSGYYGRESEALVFDLSDPTAPVQRGTATLPVPVYPYIWYGCGDGWGWWPYFYGGSWAVGESGLGILNWSYQYQRSEQSLVYLDLSNPSAPSVSTKLLSTTTWSSSGSVTQGRQYVNLVGDGKALVATFREKVGRITMPDGTAFAKVKYYAVRFSSGIPQPQAPVNLPGRLIRTWEEAGQRHLLTTDERFHLRQQGTSTYWEPEGRLHLLEATARDRAVLLDTMALDGKQVGDMVGDASRLFLTLRPSYWYWYAGDKSSSAAEEPSDTLVAIDLRGGKLDRRFAGSVGTYYSRLMGVSDDRLFINLPGDGVLAVDVTDLSAPAGQHFARTLGYATHIAFAGGRAFIASGNFGIYEMDLSASPSILRL